MVKAITLCLSLLLFFAAKAQEQRALSSQEIKLALAGKLTDTKRCFLLLDLALNYVYKPGDAANDLDSALLLIKNAEAINKTLHDRHIEAKTYFVYSNALREKGDTLNGHIYIKKSVAIYKKISDPAELAEACLESASYITLITQEDVSNKKPFYEEALAFFKQAGLKQRQADVLKDLADLNQLLGNYGLAIIQLNEALTIYNTIGYKSLHGVYDLMSVVSTAMGDFPNAVKYGLLAARTAESLGDTTMQLCTIYSRLAVAYGNWGKSAEADNYQKKAFDIAVKYHNTDGILVTMINLCSSLCKQKKWKASLQVLQQAVPNIKLTNAYDSIYLFVTYLFTYVAAGNYRQAKEYTNRLTAIIPTIPQNTGILATVYASLIRYFIGNHEYTTAKKYAVTFSKFAVQSNSSRFIASAYESSSRADSAMGNFSSALNNYQQYKRITDSSFNETKAFQLSQMQVAFETEKKDNDIKLLKQKDELQKVQLQQSKLTNNIIIAGIIMLAALLALLYNRFRIKQRSNKQLEIKQQEINEKNSALEKLVNDKDELIGDKDILLEEKEWLLKEIHHRVKNNLQIVISLLNTQSKFLNNPEAVEAIGESRHRMQAMSLIHQKLYQSENTGFVNMHTYIRELTDYLEASFYTGNAIRFELLIDNIELDIAQAIPLGLILNEAITNSIKYAFSAALNGIVTVAMKNFDDNNIILTISDNGKGLPNEFDITAVNTMGMRLMKGLAKQVNGTLQIENKHGVVITIAFKADNHLKSISKQSPKQLEAVS